MVDTEAAASQDEKKEDFVYQAEMQQLLDLIIHSLYQNKDIFLRELISNASDALNKARIRGLTDPNMRDKDAELRIQLTLDEEAKTIAISDSGIGMTRDELIENLGTIAQSGTKAFLGKLKEASGQEGKGGEAQDLIGKFGVGFYSAFMVATTIRVRTLSADPEASAFEWSSTGGNSYSIAPCDKAERGTEIILELRDDDAEFAKRFKLEGILKRYSNYVSYPILIGEDQVNEKSAIWSRPKSEITEDEYKEFYKQSSGQFFDEPLTYIHLKAESPVQYTALLYIPGSSDFDTLFNKERRGLKVYSRRVFIHDSETELLPDYLRFVVGVIDSEDLPLNVSREVVQNDPVVKRIARGLTGKILGEIERLSDKEPEKFQQFWQHFSRVIKEGLHSDFERRERLTGLLRFQSSTQEPEALVSLDAYVARMKEGQKEIYTASGEDRGKALSNPKLEIFRKHELEVLLFLDPIDDFVMSAVPQHQDFKLISIDQADLSWLEDKSDEDEGEAAPSDELAKLIAQAKEAFGDELEDVVESRRLVESPCALAAGKDGMNEQMAKVMKMMNKDFEAPKRQLELNPKSPIIRHLAALAGKDEHKAFIETCLRQLLSDVLLLEGSLQTPQDLVKRDHELMSRALAALAEQS